MAKRAHILIYDGEFEWISYCRRKEVTSVCNPYPNPEGTIESIEVDPSRIEEIRELLKVSN